MDTSSPATGQPDAGSEFAGGDPQQLFRESLDQIDTIMIITRSRRDASGEIVDFDYVYLNAAGLRMMGRAAEEILGRGLVEMFPSHVPDGWFDVYKRAVESGEKQHVFIPTFDENGVRGSFEVDVWKFGDGYVMFGRDMSEQLERQRALEESERRFRSTVESATVGIALVSPEGTVESANPALCHMLGRDVDSLVGSRYDLQISPEDRDRVDQQVEALRGGADRIMLSDLRLVRVDGQTVWTRCAAIALRGPDGEVQHFMTQFEDMTAEHRAREELVYRAFNDPLTGLRNRSWIADILETELRAAKRSGTGVGVLFLDLDNFKVVNESLGHEAGDELLAIVADRVAGAAGVDVHVGRSGGDEFVAVVPGVAEPRALELLADRIMIAINQEVSLQGHRVVPTASLGMTVSTARSTSATLLRDADAALYRAKSEGRARWVFSDLRMHERAMARLTVEDGLRRALVEDGFEVHYQPVISLRDRTVVGHEALVRWRDPVRGLQLPGTFLQVAEETGLIVPLGELVLQKVCALLRDRPDLPGRMSVNVSAVQLARPEWAHRFAATLDEYGVPPDRLIVEITETAALTVLDSTRADLARLRDSGVGLYLDDFGTGYSSVAVLRDLPVTGLKLDASFVRALDRRDQASSALVTGMAGLVAGLGLAAVAEGIETADEEETLLVSGWGLGQGYLYARPGPEPLTELGS
ncbi:MAG: EAL domain-containing protein [Candidatus Nanopelagicales bacterium]